MHSAYLAMVREDRVRKIFDPMLAGDQTADDVLDDDFAYVQQLGQSTLTLADRIRAARQVKSRVEYAPYQLSQSLKLIGQLIAADLPKSPKMPACGPWSPRLAITAWAATVPTIRIAS